MMFLMKRNREEETDFVREDILMKFTVITLPDGEKIDGEETAELLKGRCDEAGYIWMSVSSLPRGMASKRAARFRRAIQEGQRIRLFICVNNEHYHNEVAYSALIRDIVSCGEPVACPEKENRPSRFADEKSRLWLKLENMKQETKIKAEDLVAASTGSDVKWLLEHSRMSFAYVTERYW